MRASYRFDLYASADQAFALLADPSLLDRLTPPWFRLEPAREVPRSLRAGLLLPYRFRWRGIPLPWTSRLTDWAPPGFFAYEQERGPYLYFRHEHFFEPIGGAVRVTDRIRFRTRGGPWADRWIVAPELDRIFAFRERRARELLGDAQGAASECGASLIPWTRASSSAIERPT